MKHEVVCEVYCTNMLQTWLFKNYSISVRIGNLTVLSKLLFFNYGKSWIGYMECWQILE